MPSSLFACCGAGLEVRATPRGTVSIHLRRLFFQGLAVTLRILFWEVLILRPAEPKNAYPSSSDGRTSSYELEDRRFESCLGRPKLKSSRGSSVVELSG